MDIKDIYWVSGILEGEGHFGYYNAPRIHLKMTDRDVVEKVKLIMNVNVSIGEQSRSGWKTCYILAVNSHQAIGWMMTLYPLMSARRKEQIKEVLSNWRNAKSHNGFTIATGKALIRAIARKHAIPQHEAKRGLYSGKYVTDLSTNRTYIG
jgi:hypothetical protein